MERMSLFFPVSGVSISALWCCSGVTVVLVWFWCWSGVVWFWREFWWFVLSLMLDVFDGLQQQERRSKKHLVMSANLLELTLISQLITYIFGVFSGLPPLLFAEWRAAWAAVVSAFLHHCSWGMFRLKDIKMVGWFFLRYLMLAPWLLCWGAICWFTVIFYQSSGAFSLEGSLKHFEITVIAVRLTGSFLLEGNFWFFFRS